MTKKDYIRIAEVLRESKPEKFNGYDDGYHTQLLRWNCVCENMAYMLAQDNPLFNRNKFMQACGYND